MKRLGGQSWQHLLAVLTLVLSLSLAGGLAAQTGEEGAGTPDGAAEAGDKAADDLDADTQVRQMMSKWKETDPIARHLSERDDVAVVEGVGPPLRTDSKRWGKERSLAYTKAFVAAMNEYVSRIRTRETVKQLRKSFEKDLDESEFVFQPSEAANDYASRVATKALVLGERNLDQALLESGMSAEEIERLTPVQKKTTFASRLSIQSTKTAFGSAAGLVPVKTFEAYDSQGTSVIGVVAVRSPRMRNLASQIAARKAIRPDGDRARTPIADQIRALTDGDLVNEFGPRVWWDEHGYPTIVAFGQWAWSPEGLDNRKKARRRAFALEQAKSNARTHLSNFINASTRFEETSTRGDDVEEFSLVSRDGMVSDKDVPKITDELVKKAQVNSTVSLTGLKVRREWFSPHPDMERHELVGVVVSWSPAQEDRVRAELGKKPKHQPLAEKKAQKTSVKSGTAQSRDLMDPADF